MAPIMSLSPLGSAAQLTCLPIQAVPSHVCSVSFLKQILRPVVPLVTSALLDSEDITKHIHFMHQPSIQGKLEKLYALNIKIIKKRC